MRPGSSLGLALFCWALVGEAAYSPWRVLRGEVEPWRHGGGPHSGLPPALPLPSAWAWVDVSQLQAAAPLRPVAVQCQEAQVVVRVHRDLFGTGRLVKAAELALGSASCLPVAQSAAEGTVTFVAGLHECGSSLQVTPDALIYSTTLNYSPGPGANPVVVRSSPARVPIECHYPRRANVSSNAAQPTWAPFLSTLSSEQQLPFTLHLMNEDWSAERDSTIFQLGEVLHLQAGVHPGPHAALRLFVDSCVATPRPGSSSSPHYAFIDFHGCLLDGQLEDATSAFVSPRPRQEVLQFAVDAFKFAGGSSSLVYITCHLKASLADQAPDPLHKACSFHKATNLWTPVEGTQDVCSCCELRSCGWPRHSRRLQGPSPWQGGRARREMPSQPAPLGKEADVVLGPLLIHSWQGPPVRRLPPQDARGRWVSLLLAALAGLVLLLLALLGALTVCRAASNPL